MKKTYLTYPVFLVSFLLVSLVSLGQSLTNGLVSVWEFSESSGTVLNDLHGSNNGVNHNATVAQAGTINSSYLFHATEGDYIEVLHSSSLDASSAVSLSCWVKFEDTGTDQIAVAKPVSSSSHPSPYFAYCLMGWDYDASHVSPRFWISTENGSFSRQGDPIETGVWHHLAGVYDGSQITLYVDGASYALSATGILNTYATPLRMGANGGLGEFLNGNLDQVAVWNRALSTAEIQELYNSGSGLAYALWNPQPLAGGDIAPDAVTIEAGSSPGVITSVADASGGISPISYSWEQSVDQGSSWSASVPPGSATSYTVPELSQTTWYRRVATSGTEIAYSDLSKITVNTTGSTVVSGPLGTIAVSTHDLTVNWEESFTDGNYFLYLRAWTEETLPDGKSVQVQNGIYNFSKSASGFSMSLRNASGYLTYYAVAPTALNLEHVVLFTDTLTKIATKADLQDYWDKTALTGAEVEQWREKAHDPASITTDDPQILSLSGQELNFNSSSLAKLDADLNDFQGKIATRGANTFYGVEESNQRITFNTNQDDKFAIYSYDETGSSYAELRFGGNDELAPLILNSTSSSEDVKVTGFFNVSNGGYRLQGADLKLSNLSSGSIGAVGTFLKSTGASSIPAWAGLTTNDLSDKSNIAFLDATTNNFTGEINATKYLLNGKTTSITEDVSNNLIFTDAVVGTKTLAELASEGIWNEDTYGVNYLNNVGIGISSDQYSALKISKSSTSQPLVKLNNEYSTFGDVLEISTATPSTTPLFSRLLKAEADGRDMFSLFTKGYILLSTLQETTTGIGTPSAGRGYLFADSFDGDKLKWKTSAATYDLTTAGGSYNEGTMISIDGVNSVNFDIPKASEMADVAIQSGDWIVVYDASTDRHCKVNADDAIYHGWDLFVEGSNKGRISGSENVNFEAGANVTLGYSNADNTITISAIENVFDLWTDGSGYISPKAMSDELRLGSSTDRGSYIFQVTGNSYLSGALTSTGTLTASNFILSSDIRLKKQIKPVTKKLAEVELKQFVFKNDSTERTRYGVIAQDLEKVAPEMVYEDEAGYKKVAYIDFLIARLAELEAKVNQLESQIKVLTDEK